MTVVEHARRYMRLGAVLVVVSLAGATVWALSLDHATSPASSSPVSSRPANLTSPTSAAASSTPTTAARRPGPLATLPSRTGMALFATSIDYPAQLLKVDLDGGRVDAIGVAPSQSTAPTFLLVGPSSVVVRPYDHVPASIVDNDSRVATPEGRLSDGAYMACADGRSDSIWLMDLAPQRVDYRGLLIDSLQTTARPIAVGCDGAGQMLYRVGEQTFVTADGAPTLVTANRVVAAGPAHFLLDDCPLTKNCNLTVVERVSGARRELAVPSPSRVPVAVPVGGVGAITADGRTAAIWRATREVELLDPDTGTTLANLRVSDEPQALTFSYDGRYLFFVAESHELTVFDRETGQQQPLGVGKVHAVAARPA